MRSRFPLLALLLALALPARADVLNIGIIADPVQLDPARGGSHADRNVLAVICDKLIDTDPDMHFVPQLATSWEWSQDALSLTLRLREGVKFQDGSDFNAGAVRQNIERAKRLALGLRGTELKPIASVEVIDPLTVRLHLSTPYAPLLSLLADRSGMMVSPAAIAKYDRDIAAHLVCAGPYMLAERVAKERVVVDRFAGYWNAAAIGIDRIVFRPVPDGSLRLVKLKSGDLEIIDQLEGSDVPALEAEPHLRVVRHVAAGHRSLQFNLNAGPRAGTALGKDVRVRLALDKAIDRRALSGAVPEGLSVPNNQAEVPGSPFWDPDHPVPGRDLEGAKALLREAGVEHPSFTLDFLDTPPDRRIAEAIRAMAGEAGFDIKLEPLEGRAANDKLFAGDFATALLSLPGQADPDGNLASMTCAGPFNFGGYCNPNMEELLKLGRETADPDRRIAIYRKAAGLYLLDMPEIILGNTGWVWGVSERVEGFVPNRDGLIRPQGLRLRAQ